MSDHQDKTERSESPDRRPSFDCCGIRTGDMNAAFPCGAIVRRHPVVTSVIVAVMGLAAVLIPAGAILGIIAFFRTI